MTLSQWKLLPESMKNLLRKRAIIPNVTASMAMEGEPVSMGWLWDNDQDEFYRRLRIESMAKASR